MSKNELKNLRVSLVQVDTLWQRPLENLSALSDVLIPLAGQTDLVVLPEVFTSGFAVDAELSADQHNQDEFDSQQAVCWMLDRAAQLQAAVMGSIQVVEQGQRYNRCYFVTPQGGVEYYDKVHLFKYGGEHKRYRPGQKRVVVTYRGWRILLSICYDLRFPVFCRSQGDYDVMVCVANWPASRQLAWDTLLQARAIENQSYVVGVNRVGVDGKQISYSGSSAGFSFDGSLLSRAENYESSIQTITLKQLELVEFRRSFPFLDDRDTFTLGLHQESESDD